MQADNERPQKRRRVESEKYRKKKKKTFQKPLDKRKEMWYNNQVAQNAASAEEICSRSLTIEQQEIKVQAKLVIENLEISLKKEISNLSRIWDILNKV